MIRRFGGPGMHGAGGVPLSALGGKGQNAVKQAYLLDFASYTGVIVGQQSYGREFSVSQVAQCYGARLKVNGAQSPVAIRVYRVSDQALIASKNGLSAADGENELLFSTPATLAAATLYRIAFWRNPAPSFYRRTDGQDHPDGPIVTLTANTYCFVNADVYPASTSAANSVAMEPIIYV